MRGYAEGVRPSLGWQPAGIQDTPKAVVAVVSHPPGLTCPGRAAGNA